MKKIIQKFCLTKMYSACKNDQHSWVTNPYPFDTQAFAYKAKKALNIQKNNYNLFFSTCACGKWICTSHACSSPQATVAAFSSTEEYGNYDDMDNQVD
jgi:hypothetical protein